MWLPVRKFLSMQRQRMALRLGIKRCGALPDTARNKNPYPQNWKNILLK